MAKMGYTSKRQVTVNKPKPPKMAYSRKSQVRITKPAKPRKESLHEMARIALFEKTAKELTVLNPQTKNKIKVVSALKYPHTHPAYKAAVALLKKKNITLPPNIHAVKPGEQIPLFNLKPYEDPKRASLGRLGSALSDEALIETMEKQSDYLSGLPYEAREAINTYCGDGFQWINSYLRQDIDDGSVTETIINHLQDQGYGDENDSEDSWNELVQDKLYNDLTGMEKAFSGKECILNNDILVYRGISERSGIVEELMDGGVGTIIEDSGYISTSVDKKVAKAFAGDSNGAILKIVARKGTRALYPQADNMGMSHEKEVILNKNSRMKVVSIGTEKIKGDYDFVEYNVITVETVIGEEE